MRVAGGFNLQGTLENFKKHKQKIWASLGMPLAILLLFAMIGSTRLFHNMAERNRYSIVDEIHMLIATENFQ